MPALFDDVLLIPQAEAGQLDREPRAEHRAADKREADALLVFVVQPEDLLGQIRGLCRAANLPVGHRADRVLLGLLVVIIGVCGAFVGRAARGVKVGHDTLVVVGLAALRAQVVLRVRAVLPLDRGHGLQRFVPRLVKDDQLEAEDLQRLAVVMAQLLQEGNIRLFGLFHALIRRIVRAVIHEAQAAVTGDLLPDPLERVAFPALVPLFRPDAVGEGKGSAFDQDVGRRTGGPDLIQLKETEVSAGDRSVRVVLLHACRDRQALGTSGADHGHPAVVPAGIRITPEEDLVALVHEVLGCVGLFVLELGRSDKAVDNRCNWRSGVQHRCP